MGRSRKASLSLLTGLFTLFFLLPGIALADRGMIRPTSAESINLEEPAQRAIVAHNGTHEVIILQTDVRADAQTKIVEFMPLPSEPKVSLAPEGCFAALQEIIRTRGISYGHGGSRARNDGLQGGLEVVITAELGPHHVTVVKATAADELMQWIKEFFEEHDLGEPWLEDNLRSVVNDYGSRGYHYFAFDVLTIPIEKKTVQPLIYDFACDYFYYPLKVTNLYGGTGTVELFTLLAKDHRIQGRPPVFADICAAFPGKQRARRPREAEKMQQRIATSSPVGDLARDDIKKLAPRLAELMGDDGGFLMALRYEGKLDFDKDVWVEMIPAEPVAWMPGRWWRGHLPPGYEAWHALAGSSSTSPETLAMLARDRNPNVRWPAARNSRMPAQALAALVRDDDRDVRIQVTRNPSVTEDMLRTLAQDRDVRVSAYAKIKLDTLGVDASDRSQLSGVLKKSDKGPSPYVLELDGMTGKTWLRGEVLKDIPENARIRVRGVIRSEVVNPTRGDGSAANPMQWHVFMDVIECWKISSPFENPREVR